MAMDQDLIDTGFDSTRRELCPDGACLGVIGADGRCKVCGTTSPGGPDRNAMEPDEGPPPAATSPETQESVLEEQRAGADGPQGTEDDAFDAESRELCPEGTCLGVIGADGRCNVCGTPAA